MSTILFVDDEDSILRSIKRLFALHDFDILTATSGKQALEIIKKKTISVLVSDQRMPNMLGSELVATVKEISPQTIRMILTGYADLDSILGAINKGEIFRFVLKPWNNEELIGHVTDALNAYNKSRDQVENVILGLAQTIELKDPYTKGHCQRVARYAVALAEQYGLEESLICDIRHGAWLHDCGKIAVHEDILNFPGSVSEAHREEIRKHPENGVKVAQEASLSQQIQNIILCHHERVDGTGYPNGLSRAEIPIEAKIVAVADVYDAIATDRPYRKACDETQIRKILAELRGSALDEQLVDLFINKIMPQTT